MTVLLVLIAGVYSYVTVQQFWEKAAPSSRTIENVLVLMEALPEDFSLVQQDSVHNQVFLNVYEGLTSIDSFFRVKPGLAYSWGTLDEEGLLWEFQLREGVQFHNGEVMTPEHVLESFAYYREEEPEVFKHLTNSIDTVELQGNRLRITTVYPDPLLLYRLSFLFVLPQDRSTLADQPVGTGPYRIMRAESGSINFGLFEDYWGPKPAVQNARMAVIADTFDRQDVILEGGADIVMAVPADRGFLQDVSDDDTLELVRMPSLEVVYVMMNTKEFLGRTYNVLNDRGIRRALLRGIQREALAQIPQFAKVATQYVASGVFGYDVNMELPDYAPDQTELILDGRYVTVTLALPKSFELLGQALQSSLDPLNITVDLKVFEDNEIDAFLKGIEDGDFQMYMIGHKYDVADGVDFFRSVIHSQEGDYGTLNGSGLRDIELDDQIKRAERILDQEERLQILHDIQREVVDLEIGLPLFEVDRVYIQSTDLKWDPRMDGYMVLKEIE